MFIGRWQPLHKGHQWLINQRLEKGKNVLICIRDVKADEKNPFSPQQVLANVTKHYTKEIKEEQIKVVIIPDIESINYGRGVGYEIIEHVPPNDIKEISATKIRKEMGL